MKFFTSLCLASVATAVSLNVEDLEHLNEESGLLTNPLDLNAYLLSQNENEKTDTFMYIMDEGGLFEVTQEVHSCSDEVCPDPNANVGRCVSVKNVETGRVVDCKPLSDLENMV